MKIHLARKIVFEGNNLVKALEKGADIIEIHLLVLDIISICNVLEKELRDIEKKKVCDA